jgi:hypothetical protein
MKKTLPDPAPRQDTQEQDGLYGLSWEAIFRLRDAVARRWYYKFWQRIPLEEFLSQGNLVITQCSAAYDPTGSASFATVLHVWLRRRMSTVIEQEWRGCTERVYAGKHTAQFRPPYTIVHHWPAFDQLPLEREQGHRTPAVLHVAAAQEPWCFLQECVAFLETTGTPKEQASFWEDLAGGNHETMARREGMSREGVRKRVIRLRAKLLRWHEDAYA